MSASESQDHTIENAVKLVGETFVPGASLLLDGKIVAGVAHLIVGVGAKMALGPIGLGLVIANSYSTSVTGKNLLKQVSKDDLKGLLPASKNGAAVESGKAASA